MRRPRFRKRFHLSYERPGIYDYARSDYRVPLRPQNSARNELQDKAFFSYDDRVPCVVASGNTSDIVKGAGQVVNDLAFALIAPLRANHHHGFHAGPFPIHTSAPYRSLLLNFCGFHNERQLLIVSSPRLHRKPTAAA